jgi:hypothetical protein
MQPAQLRGFWPELTLIAVGLILVLGLMVTSATPSCHHWKVRLHRVNGAFLASAGAEEYPKPERGVADERDALTDAARRLLDERPFGCL